MFCWQQLEQYPIIFIQRLSTAQHPAHTFQDASILFLHSNFSNPVFKDAEMVPVKNCKIFDSSL